MQMQFMDVKKEVKKVCFHGVGPNEKSTHKLFSCIICEELQKKKQKDPMFILSSSLF